MKYLTNTYIEVVIASIIFWAWGTFIKFIELPATSIAFFRMAIPTIVIGLWIWYQWKSFRHTDKKNLMILSSLNVIRMYLYFVWFTMTSAGTAVVSLYTSPVFAMIFAVWLLWEKMNIVRYMSIVLAVIWLVTIWYGKWLSLTSGDMIGIAAIVLSAFIQWYITVLMKTSLRTYDKVSLIFYQCCMGAIIFLPFVFYNEPLPTFEQIWVSSVYAVIIGIVWFVLYFSALKKADMTVVSILTYMEMVSGIIFAWLLLWEIITSLLIIWSVFIIISGISLMKEKNILSFVWRT